MEDHGREPRRDFAKPYNCFDKEPNSYCIKVELQKDGEPKRGTHTHIQNIQDFAVSLELAGGAILKLIEQIEESRG